MVKKRKWTEDQRNNFSAAMARRKFDKRLKQNQEMKALRTIDVSVWDNEQRPTHIYVQEAGRLRRYELRSLEVYVPEDTSL